jgi:hypothetical protein
MPLDTTNLAQWFSDRPAWMQEATRLLLANGELSTEDIGNLTKICKASEPKGPKTKSLFSSSAFERPSADVTLRLKRIAEVKGIDALNPKSPLSFGGEALTVVYGGNGTGKSGYIRILNNVCGARNGRGLLGNVYSGAAPQSCKIGYSLDGADHDLTWVPALGAMPELSSLEIYDSDCAHIYISEENEVAYEPWLLRLFRQLVDACASVEANLSAEAAKLASKKPQMPPEFAATPAGVWYQKIGSQTPATEIAQWCSWVKSQKDQLQNLQRRLSEKDPAEQAAKLRKRKTALAKFSADLARFVDALGDANVDSLLMARKDASTKRKAASEDAAKVFGQAPLEGVGQESWQLLWDQARAYSEEVAYKEKPFPVTVAGARCVLCHQSLDSDAKQRLSAFEKFVKGELEDQAKAAERKLKGVIEKLPVLPTEDELGTRLEALGIDAADAIERLQGFRKQLQSRRDALLVKSRKEDVSPLPPATLAADPSTLAQGLEKDAAAFDEDAKKDNLAELKKQAKELEAVKWMSEQKASIEGEVSRLKKIDALRTATRLTSTTALSMKKSELSEAMVSDAFIRRFGEELDGLSASRIRVELVKTGAKKGQVWHQLRLKDAKIKASISDILSEGERRIISIAAFLADVEGIEANTPFVFDDPISSLDQDFEEAVVARLVTLSGKRQVIVFTHRLSLLSQLEDAAKSGGVTSRVVALNREDWGTGEPSETLFSSRPPDKVINGLMDQSLSAARKVLAEKGKLEYSIHAKSICSEIRILVERLVEEELTNHVVKRFRRSVQTYNRLGALAKINADDCKLLDGFMTKYSRYEHSHSKEAPVALPPPAEIKTDLEKLKAWLSEFKSRK